MLEVDLLQRPREGRMNLGSYGRKALAELLKKCASSLAALPLQGIRQKGDMLCGFVDLPSTHAANAVKESGSVRGVFVRRWVAGGDAYPMPPGFSANGHRVVWVKVARFSDVVYSTLRNASVPFDGLVCPRTKGEVGVRVQPTADISNLLSVNALKRGCPPT